MTCQSGLDKMCCFPQAHIIRNGSWVLESELRNHIVLELDEIELEQMEQLVGHLEQSVSELEALMGQLNQIRKL